MVLNPLHARIPIDCFKRNVWCNYCFDINAFANFCFKGVSVRSLDQIILTATCKFRRIFTSKNAVLDNDLEIDPVLVTQLEQLIKDEQRDPLLAQVPKGLGLPADLDHQNQYLFPQRIDIPKPVKQVEEKRGEIAFGRRISAIKGPPKKEKSPVRSKSPIRSKSRSPSPRPAVKKLKREPSPPKPKTQ
jgi:hypothetical protein